MKYIVLGRLFDYIDKVDNLTMTRGESSTLIKLNNLM